MGHHLHVANPMLINICNLTRIRNKTKNIVYAHQVLSQFCCR